MRLWMYCVLQVLQIEQLAWMQAGNEAILLDPILMCRLVLNSTLRPKPPRHLSLPASNTAASSSPSSTSGASEPEAGKEVRAPQNTDDQRIILGSATDATDAHVLRHCVHVIEGDAEAVEAPALGVVGCDPGQTARRI